MGYVRNYRIELVIKSSKHYKVYKIKTIHPGVPVVAQWLTNLTRKHEVVGSVPGLTQWVKDLALP